MSLRCAATTDALRKLVESVLPPQRAANNRLTSSFEVAVAIQSNLDDAMNRRKCDDETLKQPAGSAKILLTVTPFPLM